jgi:anti-sigma factor RsiW
MYLEDELSADEEDRVRDHLAECIRCAGAYTDFEMTVGLLKRLPKEEASPEFASIVVDHARRRAGRPISLPALVAAYGEWLPRVAAAAATMVIGFALGYAAFAIGSRAPSTGPVADGSPGSVEAPGAAFAGGAVGDSASGRADGVVWEGPGDPQSAEAPIWRVRAGTERPSIVF